MKILFYSSSIIVFIVIVVVGSMYFIFSKSGDVPFSPDAPKSTDSVTVASPVEKSLTEDYVNSTYKFSFKMPEDFSARESGSPEQKIILLENKQGEGIQILVSPFEDIKIVTAEMMRRDLPDLKISDVKTVDIKDGYKGISFKSDNQSFAGASEEIWFVFRGNLYQISTFEKFGNVLKNMFATWKFIV